MNRTIRKIALLLSHIGLLLSIVYLGFFLVCTVRAQKAADPASNPSKEDLYLTQAMHEHDFSVFTVGKALSDANDPARENLFIALDLIVPLFCLASGILLQFAAVRPKRKKERDPSQPTKIRR